MIEVGLGGDTPRPARPRIRTRELPQVKVCAVNGHERAKRQADQVADALGRVLLVPGCITTDRPYLLWHGGSGSRTAGTAAEHGRARADVLREE